MLRAFACVAADPRLGAVLLFDVPPAAVGPVADLFARIVAEAEDADDEADGRGKVLLGAAPRDGDIWSRTLLHAADGAVRVESRPGPLVEGDPAANISDVRKTVMVVKDGVRFDPKELYAAVGVKP